MQTRITVTLSSDEKNALHLLAMQEFRDTRAQAALIIRRELEQRGLLLAQAQPTQPELVAIKGAHDAGR
jgi:hypothetical protein